MIYTDPPKFDRIRRHNLRSAMNRDDVELINRSTAYQGYFRVNAYQLRHRLFAGGWSDPIQREVFERGHAAGAILYDPQADAVVLIEQFRAGAYAAGDSPWLVEVVAGVVEPGESPEEVVRRESIEEAGCTVLDLVPICRYFVSPGGTSETVALYCARIDSRGAGGIHGLAHEHEDIRVEVVPVAQALAQIASGRINNAPTIIALQYLALNRESLRRRWA